MTQIKTAELEGAALDWAVAKCEGWNPQWDETPEDFFLPDCPECFTHLREFCPSTNWAQGGPIIEREKISLIQQGAAGLIDTELDDVIAIGMSNKWAYGATLLIAAMRCYVASKLGDVVEVPDELIQQSA